MHLNGGGDMPITVSTLFNEVKLDVHGPVRWKAPLNCDSPGVYVVALSTDPNKRVCIDKPPFSNTLIDSWINRVPNMRIKKHKPDILCLTAIMNRFWLPKETILYIGSTTRTLGKRVDEFYKHILGDGSPHSGGHWLKTLSNIDDLFVYWCGVQNTPGSKENEMLNLFHSTAAKYIKVFHQYQIIMPFANLRAPAIDPKRKWYYKQLEISSPTL